MSLSVITQRILVSVLLVWHLQCIFDSLLKTSMLNLKIKKLVSSAHVAKPEWGRKYKFGFFILLQWWIITQSNNQSTVFLHTWKQDYPVSAVHIYPTLLLSFPLIFVPHSSHHSSQSPSCSQITAPSLSIFHSLETKLQKNKTSRVDGSNTSYNWLLASLFMKVCLLPLFLPSKNLGFSHWERKQPSRGVWFWTFIPEE